MNDTVIFTPATASTDEIQKGWHELRTRVGQLELEHSALEEENKALRFLLERVIEHRQKSHAELVLLLSGLVSKLPINDVGVVVSKLVEHNAHVNEVCAALAKGKLESAMPQPAVLKALDQTRRDLAAALKPAVEELIKSEPPLETDVLQSLVANPDLFFSPPVARANRCFLKGQLPRERILREFGEAALIFFNDLTTDPKLNPRPKPEEIVLAFKNDFEALLAQNLALLPGKCEALQALHQRVQRGKAATEQARATRNAFLKVSFLIELLHYYENQNTEAADVIFAQRLPVLVEQLAVPGAQDSLEEKWIAQAEALLAFIIHPDHRLMAINNVGKGGGAAKTLKFVLRLRAEKAATLNPATAHEIVTEFVRHLLPSSPQKPPPAAALAAVLRLVGTDFRKPIVRSMMTSDRVSKADGETVGRALAKELDLTGLEEETKTSAALPPAMERQMAWDRIKDLITRRTDPTAIAAAVRDRLHARYDSDEVRQSWITLIEADAISLIRTLCQLPYLPDGKTDPIAKPVMETYVTRLTHEKYAATYSKVVNSLRNLFKANPGSSTLLNFLALVKWVDVEAANKISNDVGMPHAAA